MLQDTPAKSVVTLGQHCRHLSQSPCVKVTEMGLGRELWKSDANNFFHDEVAS